MAAVVAVDFLPHQLLKIFSHLPIYIIIDQLLWESAASNYREIMTDDSIPEH